MTSDHLNHLRGIPAQLRESHRAYAKNVKAIKDSGFLDDATKKTRLAQLAATQKEALATIKATAQEKAAALRAAAVSKNAPTSTPEAKAQVLRALDAGTKWQDIARLCVAQNDRAALAALREQLPWEGAAGKLGKGARPETLLKEANLTLDAFERPLLSEPEQRAREELRELNACQGANDANFKILDEHYTGAQNPLNMTKQYQVEKLYNWVGIPVNGPGSASNVGATSMTLPIDDPAPMGYDVMSRSMKPIQEVQA